VTAQVARNPAPIARSAYTLRPPRGREDREPGERRAAGPAAAHSPTSMTDSRPSGHGKTQCSSRPHSPGADGSVFTCLTRR
jgi:hypothetical protein